MRTGTGYSKTLSKMMLSMALLLVVSMIGCSGGGGGGGGTNSAPVANAGLDQNVVTGAVITLDGSGSSDANGDFLTFIWSFTSKPAGSSATLSSSTVVKPTFMADKDGTYVLSLVVNDGKVDSSADTVTITATTGNAAPIANAGPDQNIGTGSVVTLDGSGSSDANGDALTYNWSFTSMPIRSIAVLSSATAVKPTFLADKDGVYVLSLVVNDGKVDSTPDTVTISAATVGPAPVSLGTPGDLKAAGSYVILTETSIVNTSTSKITGDIGLSPGLTSNITGFGALDKTGIFSTSSQVTGSIFASDNASPTPANLASAVSSMVAAYNDAAGRPAGTGANLDLGSGTLIGGNLAPGTYTWSSFPDVDIQGDITLTGTATDVWIFQIPGTLILESPISVNLAGGALAQNIFWQVAGDVTIRTNAHLEGIILGQKSITLETGASITGRALAQTAVTLDSNEISAP